MTTIGKWLGSAGLSNEGFHMRFEVQAWWLRRNDHGDNELMCLMEESYYSELHH